MYTRKFLAVENEKIIKAIRENGYFVFEAALTKEYVESILQEVDFEKVLVNTNDVGVVFSGSQQFLTHCLAKSKKVYNVITSSKVLDICNKYFLHKFLLVNHRIYQTKASHYMPWHTDNNRQVGYQLSEKHNMPGLLFLFYLSDVTKNAFQIVRKSHNWADNYNHEIYLSESFIKKFEKDIVTLQMPQGSLIICNTHVIHRAEPLDNKNYVRKTLLFQVDEVGDGVENVGHGEPNLINTEYLENLSPAVVEYLGFGRPRNYPTYPYSSVSTVSNRELVALQKQLLLTLFKAIPKKMVIALVSYRVIIAAKRMMWKIKHN
jgi:ectoine hydroxylase-related dioxygenase (phytanoyl-CoA dioxygenase family)